jgi:hypothetical protein
MRKEDVDEHAEVERKKIARNALLPHQMEEKVMTAARRVMTTEQTQTQRCRQACGISRQTSRTWEARAPLQYCEMNTMGNAQKIHGIGGDMSSKTSHF